MKTKLLHLLKAAICLLILSIPVQKAVAQTYCSPAFLQGCALGSEVNTFKVTGASSTSINDVSTGCTSSGYQDNHSTMSVTFNQGATYTAQANSGVISFGTDYIQVWIDFDNDGTFSTAESVGGGGPMSGSLGNYVLTIPATANPGSHRMRVEVSGDLVYPALDPCPFILTSIWGEVHDYTAIISGSIVVCAPVTGVTLSAITAASATVSWTAVTGAVGYEWAVTTSATPPATGTATSATTANATGLAASTVYYAHVRTKCSATSFSTWVTTTFTTASSSSTPCAAPVLSLGTATTTSQVVNWAAVTGATGYEWTIDMTAAAPTVAGTATALTTCTGSGLTSGGSYYAHVRTNCGSSFSSWTTIPFTVGSTPSACDTVTGLSVSGITTSMAILNWTAVAVAASYEWRVNTTAAAPTASGITTALTTGSATGLTPGTVYYAHVRVNCGTGFSAWVTVPFTTIGTGCNPVTGLNATAITGTSATVGWTAVAGSPGYQYVIDNTPTSPAGSGTNIATTSTPATGLTSGTTYYAHVRDSCGPGNFSAWVTIPFTTLSSSCNAVTALTASAITAHTATITWVRPAGTIAAQYVIDNSPLDPMIIGTTITLSTKALTGLNPSTTYYAHVRDSCGATAKSAWVTIPLTTLASGVGIVNVNAAATFGITAYPNPVSGMLTVELEGTLNTGAQIQLMDVTGKLITALPATGHLNNIDMGGLSSGLYLVRYADAAHTQTIKVSKQ